MDNNNQLQQFKEQISKLNSDLNDLAQNFYKNNFSSHQDLTKAFNFSTKLKVPSY